MLNSEKWIAHVISKTHWDREWYLPFQQFRMRLVDAVDELLEIFNEREDYKYFNFDGQTVVLEDYLEIRPENKEILKKHIEEGRILIGPWYVLPDQFLVSGEATIRNLLLGERLCEEFGGKMEIGYLPDSFGHISQMPQILKGFDMDTVVLWRGLSGEPEDVRSELWWTGSDGSKVLLVKLPDKYGYCIAPILPVDPDEGYRVLRELTDYLKRAATTSHLLIINGADHLKPQRELGDILENANNRFDDIEFVHDSLSNYVEAVKRHIGDLKEVRGELRDTNRTVGGRYNYILAGVLSTRMYLKQRNTDMQNLMERWVEPFSVIAWLNGAKHRDAEIMQAWKYLVQNHAHDSICGCSVDRVHRQMMTRFEWVEDIGEQIVLDNFKYLSSCMDTSGFEDGEIPIHVFNPLGWIRTELVEVEIDLPIDCVFREIQVVDMDGRSVDCQVIYTEEKRRYYSYTDTYSYPAHVVSVGVRFVAENVSGVGWKTYRLRVLEKSTGHKTSLITGSNVMENRYLRVTVNSNGTLDILDKSTGEVYKGLHYFEDGGDIGDEYIYSNPLVDTKVTTCGGSAMISIAYDGPDSATFKVEQELHIPESATEDRRMRSSRVTTCRISSLITLHRESRRVDIKTTVLNTAKDHRLRVVFPTRINTEYSYAEGQFDVVKRSIYPKEHPPIEAWIENVPLTHPQQSFVDLSDGQRGLAILNKGLPDYEVSCDNERKIYLTLLRCVGYISAPYSVTAKDGAAPIIETEESQCLGKYTFEYSIYPHSGNWEEAQVYKQAHGHLVPFRAFQGEIHGGRIPLEEQFMQIVPETLVLTGVKKADRRDSLIVRMFNIGTEDVEGRIRLSEKVNEAYKVNLRERRLDALKVNTDNSVVFTASPKEIVTLEFVYK